MNGMVNSAHIVNGGVNSAHGIRGWWAVFTLIFQRYLIVYGAIAPLIFIVICCVDITCCSQPYTSIDQINSVSGRGH